MISYSKRALRGLAYIFRPYNDIDIYVEDTKDYGVYEILINRILHGNATVKRIFPLGGREAVIQACRDNQYNDERNTIYIIDGDFYKFHNEIPEGKLENLYQLNVYCMENLLFCREAIHAVSYENLVNMRKENINDYIDFDTLLNHLVLKLLPLFIIYAIAFKLDNSIETSGKSIYHFRDKRSNWKLASGKIQKRIDEIRNQLLENNTEEEILNITNRIEESLPIDNFEIAKLFSGKTYILPLCLTYMADVKRCYQGNMSQFKRRLAQHCDLNIDVELKNTINNIAHQ